MRTRLNDQPPARAVNALADALQADASRARTLMLQAIGVKAHAIILDPELQSLTIAHQRNAHLGRARVLRDIGECLLNDAKDLDLERLGNFTFIHRDQALNVNVVISLFKRPAE